MVSVVVPVYNTEKYLSDCLDSLINQSMRNIEIICINDGSTDGSLNILQAYAAKDDRIKIINQQNHGLSYTRNKGVELSEGKYIYFFDSDDMLANNALEQLYFVAEENDSEVVFFDGEAFFESDQLEKKHVGYKGYYDRFCDISGVTDGKSLLDWCKYNNKIVVSACLALLNKEFLINNEIKFYEGIYYEDNLFHLKLLSRLKTGYVIHERYFRRRVRNDSIMTNQKVTFKHLYSWFICYCETIKMLPSYEGIGKEDCLPLLLNQFYNNIMINSKALKGQVLSENDMQYYNKLNYTERLLLGHLGVSMSPVLSSISRYCGAHKIIAIYGAGVVGVEIYKLLSSNNQHKLYIIDRRACKLRVNLNIDIKQPQDLSEMRFDIMIVSVKDRGVAQGIIEQLHTKYGISKRKMIWYGHCVSYVID